MCTLCLEILKIILFNRTLSVFRNFHISGPVCSLQNPREEMRASSIIPILSIRLRHKSRSHTQGQVSMWRPSRRKNPGCWWSGSWTRPAPSNLPCMGSYRSNLGGRKSWPLSQKQQMVCYFLLGCPRKMLQNSHILWHHRNSDWNSRQSLLRFLLCSSARCSRASRQGHCCCVKTVGLTAACSALLCEPSPVPPPCTFPNAVFQDYYAFPWKCWLTRRRLSGHWGKWHEGFIITCQPKFLDLLWRGHCSTRKKGLFINSNRNDFFFSKRDQKDFEKKEQSRGTKLMRNFWKGNEHKKGEVRKENTHSKKIGINTKGKHVQVRLLKTEPFLECWWLTGGVVYIDCNNTCLSKIHSNRRNTMRWMKLLLFSGLKVKDWNSHWI